MNGLTPRVLALSLAFEPTATGTTVAGTEFATADLRNELTPELLQKALQIIFPSKDSEKLGVSAPRASSCGNTQSA